ncbi:MAG TPA: PepSY domain-containing protein, partial [Dyadobacter sp.]|nr:PepSY domain-containing protein [Dyadobacter sp.]
SIAISLKNGKIVSDNLPGHRSYAQSILPGIARLHFATFGGLALKTIYFFMALFTCFVIISGVLLWKEARNKKSYTDKQKRFHHRVTMSHLAICFGLFPAIAVLFCAGLMIPDIDDHAFYTRTAFFLSWLLFTMMGLFTKTEIRTTQLYLHLGGIFSLCVPIVNGVITGDWLWIAVQKGYQFVAITDLCWFVTGTASLLFAYLTWRRNNQRSNETIIADKNKIYQPQ